MGNYLREKTIRGDMVFIYLAFETVKNLVEHILQVWFWVLPRGDGIAKENEVIDNALGTIHIIRKHFLPLNTTFFEHFILLL